MPVACLDATTSPTRKITLLTESRDRWRQLAQLANTGSQKKLHRHPGIQQTSEAHAGKLLLSQHSSIGCCLHERYIPGATFPLAMVLMAVLLMLRAATSLQAAATAIEISEQVYRNRLLAGPDHNTVRNYLLRLGLYELTRSKAVLDD